jgi:F-type H+-transporting ATPase subunit b
MLEFNQWYFVLVANFVVLLIVLNALLFKPLAKIFKERDVAIKGALDEAKALTARKDDAIATMNAELSTARTKAKDLFNSLREEGLAREKEVLAKTEAEAVELIDRARRDLKAETEKARAALRTDVEKFSEEIVKKLVRV